MQHIIRIALIVMFLLSCSSPPEDVGRARQAIGDEGHQSDPENCGVDGWPCRGGRTCEAGRCVPAWIPMSTVGQPAPRGAAAGGHLGGKFVVFGGCGHAPPVVEPALATTYLYDTETDTWQQGPDLPQGVLGHGSTTTPDGLAVYGFGGLGTCWDGRTTGPRLYRLTDASSSGAWEVITAPNSPEARYSTAMSSNEAGIFVYGGATATSPAIASGGYFDGTQWSDISCGLLGCERSNAYSIWWDSSTHELKVWGGHEGSYPQGLALGPLGWGTWDASAAPDFWNDVSSGGFQIQTGESPLGVYLVDNTGHVHFYNHDDGSWWTDPVAPPPGLCNEGATSFLGSELVVWSGVCSWNFSSVGWRYQPPAPGLAP